MAMDRRYFAIARVLVTAGADPNKTDRFGQTALAAAAWDGIGDLEGVKVLLSMGALVDLEQLGGLSGMVPSGTALHVAAAAGRTEICKSLLDAGANVNKQNQKGSTPLSSALSRAAINCAPVLLEHGAEVNSRDIQGRTPLMYLMAFDSHDPVVQHVFDDMVARGADPDVRDNSEKTAEDWARYFKHDLFVEQLRHLRESKAHQAQPLPWGTATA